MQPFVVSKKSWHYWLADYFSSWYPSSRQLNLCSYGIAVAKGGALFLFLSTVALLAVICLLSALFHYPGHLFGLIHRSANGWEVVGGAIWILFGVWIVHGIYQEIKMRIETTLTIKRDEREKQKATTAPPSPGFVKTAWKSFKERYCVPIELSNGPKP